MEAIKHVDGGLINKGNASHVIAAIQALLHSSPMVQFLLEDDNHFKTCRSLLQCVMCSLRRIYNDMSTKGIGDPTPLVYKWQGTSSRMTLGDQNNPLQVLLVFIDVMRVQHISRSIKGNNPECQTDAFTSHHLTNEWCSVAEIDVSCPSCGKYSYVKHIPAVKVTEIVNDVKDSIIETLLDLKEETCTRCQRELASTTNKDVILAQSLIVHIDRCSHNFSLPFNLELQENKLSLKSVIAQQEGKPSVFVAMCPDGSFRKFTDSSISKVSPAALCTAEFIRLSKLTLIFEEENTKSLPQKLNTVRRIRSKTSMKKDTIMILGSPDLSDLLDDTLDVASSNLPSLDPPYDGVSSHPNTTASKRNVSTQTFVPVTADKAIQTNPMRFASYERCKNSPKFQFFTGLSVEDFNALFNLIGGAKVIRTLKLHYDQNTPVKLRETSLTCEDKLFMFLLRLRRGIPLEEMSEIFNLSVGMISLLFYAMTRLIYLTFKAMEEEMFVSAEHQKKSMPKKMRHFHNLRVLLDGASFFIETPSNFEQQGNTFSVYKSHNVLLFSIGISCTGATIFCSDGMEGVMSDKEVILKSGLLDRLSKGDGVMTDRGYELTAELQAIGCYFYKPPNLGTDRLEFTSEEEILTKAIASARIYTEHAIADIKDNRLLRGTIPLTMLPLLGDLVYIAAYLRNFSPCRIRDRRIVVEEDECQGNLREENDIDDPLVIV